METAEKNSDRRVSVRVRGIVQGVGFRPWVYTLALRYGLNGRVRNGSQGVEIEISGDSQAVNGFLCEIPAGAPPLARIDSVEVEELPSVPLEPFHIDESRSDGARSTLISPDVATCPDCLRELFDPGDRRYRYPFINCTHCGPRYTIITDIPYDRAATTMAPFPMCEACRKEYHDPLDRRFHAQPVACPDCGPLMHLETLNGETIAHGDTAVREASARLDSGSIVAVKGLGGFHLAVNALDRQAVIRLRLRKLRDEKPFAVMVRDMDAVRRHCEVDEQEESLLTGLARPIVLLKKRRTASGPGIAEETAPRNRRLGVLLPYTPLHHLLFDGNPDRVLVMTSANRSDEPMVAGNDEARERLAAIADFLLLHDRDIYIRCDDSVVRVQNGVPRPIRRSRGMVPLPVKLGESVPPVLGVGAEIKNTICVTRGNAAFLSGHIGDLENLETLHAFEKTVRHMERILEVRPQAVVHDLHPDYLGTRWALEQTHVPRFAVQHHHAHIAAVMAERGVEGPVLGLALDGSGYGTDGTVWGGELLRVDGETFHRLGHLRRVPLPGGNAAVKEPWRMALAWLEALDPAGTEARFGEFIRKWGEDKARIVLQMIRKGINSPPTSSCGRLFDAVAALVGLRSVVTYEGQAAMELEQAVDPEETGAYRGEIETGSDALVIDPSLMVREVVREMEQGISAGRIAARFHNGLADLFVDAACVAARKSGLRRMALSGGVFQNAVLSLRMEDGLREKGFEVFVHTEIPANDACIALGQAWIGARLMARRG